MQLKRSGPDLFVVWNLLLCASCLKAIAFLDGLKLFSQPRHGDIKLLPVFGNRTPGNIITLFL